MIMHFPFLLYFLYYFIIVCPSYSFHSDFISIRISRTIPNEPNDEEDKDTHFEYQGCNFNEPIIAMDSDDLDEDDELEIPDEMSRLIEHDDKGIVPNPEEVEIVNLGSEDDKQEVRIGTKMTEDERARLIDLLREFKDIFAWSYQDMICLA